MQIGPELTPEEKEQSKYQTAFDILSQGHRVNVDHIAESGPELSRVFTYAKSGLPFALMSAYRQERSEEANKDKTVALMSDLSSARLLFTQVDVLWWQESNGEIIEEIAFFVWDAKDEQSRMNLRDFQSLMARSCSTYEQTAILFSDGTRVGSLSKSGSFTPKVTYLTFDTRKMKELWSESRGRKFACIEGLYTASYSGSFLVHHYWRQNGIYSDIEPENLFKHFEDKMQRRVSS